MEKRAKGFMFVCTLAAIVLLGAWIAPSAFAAPKIKDIKGMNYSVEAGMVDNLKSLKGKKVTVTTCSGATFSGTVKKVGNHLLHLEKLSPRKDFFDALIRIEKITAIEARFREFAR